MFRSPARNHPTGSAVALHCRWPMAMALALALSGAALGVQAQKADKAPKVAAASSEPPRTQVKMERDEFLKTHRWGEVTSMWIEKTPARAMRPAR